MRRNGSNGPSTHRAVVPMHIPGELDEPWQGDPPQPPEYDENDWYQVALLA